MAETGDRQLSLKRIGLQALGWTLVVLGVAMLALPGPGMLGLVAGLAVLSTQYRWARERLDPVKNTAFRAAEEGVSTWGRISLSCLGALLVMAVGVTWIIQPGVPTWWPIAEFWWLPGGMAVGISVVLGGVIALGFIVYSIRRFRHR